MSAKTNYFNLLFPILCINIIHRASVLESSVTAQFIGKAFTNLATSSADLFKMNLLQVKEADRIHLQTVMRYIIQQQQQQQQQNGGGDNHSKNNQTSSSSNGAHVTTAGGAGGGGSLSIDMNKYKLNK